MKFSKIFACVLAVAALVAAPVVYATSPIALGGSIFPLTLISTPPINLTDAFNEMLELQAVQDVGISATYANAMTEPTGGVDTSQTLFSTSIQGNPLGLLGYADVSATLTSTTGGTVLIASATNRTIHPTGPATIMASGTAGTLTALALRCSGGAVLESFPVALLVNQTPVFYSTVVGFYSAFVKGCPSGEAVMVSNGGTAVTTTTDYFINFPYTAQ